MQILSTKLRAKLKASGYKSIAIDSYGKLWAYMAPADRIELEPYGYVVEASSTFEARLILTIDPITMEGIDWAKTLKAL